jgi:hypothetical protein
MSTAARPVTAGSPVAGPAGGGGVAEPGDVAGRLLGRLSVLPVLVVMAWLLAGLPLLLAGRFTAVAMLVVSVPLAVVLLAAGLRWIPGRWPGAWPAPAHAVPEQTAPAQASQDEAAPAQAVQDQAVPGPDKPRSPASAHTPWWAVAGVVAVAVAFGVDQMIYHSQFIIPMRDPGSYIQFGYWIAHHGSLPIPQARAAFGGGQSGLSFGSFAFYQRGGALVPQFMAGLPMILAAGFWIGGLPAAVAMAPVLGACAVLTFGGLAARLAGPRWAPLAALVLAVSLPEQFTSRSTYSEPVAQILFLGGLCLVIDALADHGPRAAGSGGTAGYRAGAGPGPMVLAALGGLALGLTLLVRIDGASDILPVIPYCGLLLVSRRRQAVPLAVGLVAGAVFGLVDGMVLSRPYLASIKSSLVPLGLAGVVVVIATVAAVALWWRRGLPQVRGGWLPDAAAVLAFAVLAVFVIRPYLQTVRGGPATIAGYQRADHLPVDPGRLYAEISLHWVFWYIGIPAVALGTAGAALLARRCLRGHGPAWTLPLMVFAWAIVTFLYRPAITPDQPWASRRLVPAVLPGFIVLAVWASGWLKSWLGRRGYSRVACRALAAGCAAVLVLPAAVTTFGLGIKSGGPAGIRLTADGLAFKTTLRGESAAVQGMCAAIPRGSSVVIIDQTTGDWFTEVVRGMCGDPAAGISGAHHAAVEQVLRGIEQAGRRPVLLAARPAQLARYGGPVRQVMKLRTTQDAHTLTTAPLGTWKLAVNVWMSEPSQ